MNKLLIALLTIFMTAATARASVDPYDLIVRADLTSSTFVVRTTVTLNTDATLELLSPTGVSVYNSALPAGHYLNKRFPLASMMEGEYLLIITDEIGRTEQPFTLSETGIVQEVAAAERLLFPQVKLQQDRVLVVNYKNENGRRVNIAVANRSGDTVFKDQVEGGAVNRAYQLNELAAGDYTVTVSGRNVSKHTTAIALH